MWMRALKKKSPPLQAAEEEKEMPICKLWIANNEGAVASSSVTMASVNLEFRTVRLSLKDRDSVVGKAVRESNHVGGEISTPV